MDRQYCAYLSDSERQMLIEDYKFEVESAKLALMIESVERRSEIQMKEAEIKILSEGGTYSDLDYLYDAVMLEAEENKKKMGIGDRISHLIQLLIDGFRTLLSGKSKFLKSGEETVEVDGDTQQKMSMISKISAGAKALRDSIKKHKKELVMGTIALDVFSIGSAAYLFKRFMNNSSADDNGSNTGGSGSSKSAPKQIAKNDIVENAIECNNILTYLLESNDELAEIEKEIKVNEEQLTNLNKAKDNTTANKEQAEKDKNHFEERSQNGNNRQKAKDPYRIKQKEEEIKGYNDELDEIEKQISQRKELAESLKEKKQQILDKLNHAKTELATLKEELPETKKQEVATTDNSSNDNDSKGEVSNSNNSDVKAIEAQKQTLKIIQVIRGIINKVISLIKALLSKLKGIFASGTSASESDDDDDELNEYPLDYIEDKGKNRAAIADNDDKIEGNEQPKIEQKSASN